MRLKEICFKKIPTVRGFEPNPKKSDRVTIY